MVKIIKNLLIFSFSLFVLFVLGDVVLAANTTELGVGFGEATGLATTDPRIVIANFIRIVLGFLGIVAVLLVLYAGFLYMTAQGQTEQIEKAKNILKGAIIGLVIILSAFGIVSFVMSRLMAATGTSTGNSSSSSGSGGGLGGGGSSNVFTISAIRPVDESVDNVRNSLVSVIFSQNIDESFTIDDEAISENFQIKKIGDIVDGELVLLDLAESVDGTLSLPYRNQLLFSPNGACSLSVSSCLSGNSRFEVVINGGVGVAANSGGYIRIVGPNGMSITPTSALNCNNSTCSFEFSTNMSEDTSLPSANLLRAQICASDSMTLTGNARDNNGIAGIKFYSKGAGDADFVLNPSCDFFGVGFGKGVTNVAQTCSFDTSAWAGSDYEFKLVVVDVAGQESVDTFGPTRVSASHCCNEVQDDDETGLDCGGAECLACEGVACNIDENIMCSVEDTSNCSDELCSTNFCNCEGDGCLCRTKPAITWISPTGGFCKAEVNRPCENDDHCTEGDTCALTIGNVIANPNGAVGNLVTIVGSGFGDVAGDVGKVFFKGSNGVWTEAQLANCTNPWSDKKIIINVPDGVINGTIRVVGNGGFEAISDEFGIPEFIVNTIKRPGLCSIGPDRGKAGETLEYSGLELSGVKAYFGDWPGSNVLGGEQSFISGFNGFAAVPIISTGLTTTYVASIASNGARVVSNFVPFVKIAEDPVVPVITSFEPTSGNIGQYITIYGRNFGYPRSIQVGEDYTVFFGGIEGGVEASFEFPEVCSDSLWKNDQVVVKVPAGLANSNKYLISMKINGVVIDSSNALFPEFTFDEAVSLKPSLCKIDPIYGPNNKPMTLWGEYFGGVKGKVEFSLNKIKEGDSISFWGVSNDANKITTTIPSDAITGPVRLINSSNQGGNSIDLKIGFCTEASDPDAACGSGICCPEFSYKTGQCQANSDGCFPDVANCTYEWEFSTGVESCEGNESCPIGEYCNLITGSCDPGSPCDTNAECPAGGICSEGRCVPPTCAGYSLTSQQCLISIEGDNCPNSPGVCKTVSDLISGSCTDNYCNDTYKECGAGNCNYDIYSNKCKLTGQICQIERTISGQAAVCNKVTWLNTLNKGVWQVRSGGGSCPAGTFMDPSSRWCNIGTVGNHQTCDLCPTGFSCEAGNTGLNSCVIDSPVCPSDAECVGGQCVLEPTCECCCKVDAPPGQDCCLFASVGVTTTGTTCDAGLCGSNEPNYGLCTGCTVLVGGSANQVLSDANCVCSGITNKTCDVNGADGRGVCVDTPLCKLNKDCNPTQECVDGQCVGRTACQQTCSSNSNPNICSPDTNLCGSGFTCNSNCLCEQVVVNAPNVCEPNEGACGENYYCKNDACLCYKDPCCQPGETITIGGVELICEANKSDYKKAISAIQKQESAEQCGVYCGCKTNWECGLALYDEAYGCALDECCRSRPTVINTIPAKNSSGACLNALVEATFSELMNAGSFSDNVVLLVKQGTLACPAGTYYETLYGINWCLVRSAPGAVNIESKTLMTLSIASAFEKNRDYKVIIKGDGIPNDSNNSGVLSQYNLGMVDNVVWEFTTGNEICAIDKVSIEPKNWLFTKVSNDISDDDISSPRYDTARDRDKSFKARALSLDDQVIRPIDNIYDWKWNWSSENNSVARVRKDNADNLAYSADTNPNVQDIIAQNVQDNSVYVNVFAQITADTVSGISTINERSSNKAEIRVFQCNNPWPPADNPETWVPWRDAKNNCSDGLIGNGCASNYNFETYYCRDAGNSTATYDDLPAIKSKAESGVIVRGESLVKQCVGGVNSGKICTANSGCGSGKCLAQTFKEIYFLREEVPVFSSGLVNKPKSLDDGTGFVVTWNGILGISNYKIYYKEEGGMYRNSNAAITPMTSPSYIGKYLSVIKEDIEAGNKYFVRVYAINAQNVESDLSDEQSVSVSDKVPPLPPTSMTINLAEVGQAELSWSHPQEDDVAYYRIGWGTDPNMYGEEAQVGVDVDPTIPNLSNENVYYFRVSAYDIWNNESNPALIDTNACDENWYRGYYLDVDRSVIAGGFSSACQHYEIYGISEGRYPNAFVAGL